MEQSYQTTIVVRISICLATLFLLFNLAAFAETVDLQIIKGRIIDSAENSPLPYSTIVLFNADSVFIAGTITNANGTFEFGKLRTGNYKVVVKFVGYNTRTIDKVALAKGQSAIDLGDIALAPSTSTLSEVTIVRKLAQVENHPDKKVINISSGGITEGGVVADALVQVPSITLDASKNVMLRGSTQFKVLIDGVPSPLDGNEALRGIALANIEKVEVITNPSSVYDSEGTAGIINIILKKEKLASVAAQVNLNASSNGSRNENFSFMGQGKKLSYNLSFDDRLQKEKSTADITNIHTDTGLTDELDSRYNYSQTFRLLKTDALYKMDAANSIQGLFWLLRAHSDQLTTDADSPTSLVGNTMKSGRENKGFMPQLRFNHKFKKEGSLFTLFAQYNNGSENSEQKRTHLDQDQFKVNMDIPFRFLMLREVLTVILNTQLTFLSGLDYKYSGFDYLYDYFFVDGNGWNKDQAKSYKSSFRSDISAAYLQLKGNTLGFGFEAGLRAENTDRVLSDEMGKEVFTYQKLSLFPSAQINRSFGENSSMMASYSRRLNRPRLYQLNPFQNYANPGYVIVGNHELLPEFQNTLELSFTQRAEKVNFNGTIYGKFTENAIIQNTFTQNDTIFFSYLNATNDRRLGTELSVNWTPGKWLTCILTGNMFNYQLKATDASQTLKNTQFETSLNLTVNPFKDLSIQSFSTLKSKSITAQGYVKGYFTSDLAITKQFLRNKLRTTIKVTDLLDQVREDETIITGNTHWRRYYKPDSRQVQFSLTLNINKFLRKASPAPEATPY